MYYVDQRLIGKLDEISIMVREILEVENDKCIGFDYFHELINKINEKFPNYKVEEKYGMIFNLKDGKNVTIYYDQREKLRDQFEFVLKAFCYGILLNKNDLNESELEDYTLFESDIYKDKYAECLSKMVMLPSDLYMKEFTLFSKNDGAVDLEGMSKKLKVKDSDIIRRGRDLMIWK